MRKTYLSGWYWRVKQRRGGKKALIALARKILTIIYAILTTGCGFNEGLYQQRQAEQEQRHQQRMIRELQKQGFAVSKMGA
jgi:hypothetical protein